MLAFASREEGLLDDRAIGSCDFERPFDVVARLLDATMSRVRRQGIDRRYVEMEDEGVEPRGAIEINRSIAQLLPAQGRIAWRVDELISDTPANRLLKCALRHLMRRQEIETVLRMRLRAHVQSLGDVADVGVLEALRSQTRVPEGLRAYRQGLRLARLALEHLLPDEGVQGRSWQALLDDPDRMGDLFERFVRGFAAFEFEDSATVSVRHLHWNVSGASRRGEELLPEMRTDVFLDWNDGPPTIGECKFYEVPLVESVYGSVRKLRSGHLYQLMSYLRAAERLLGVRARGLLVYARVGEDVFEDLVLDGYPVRVATVDLSREWSHLRTALLEVLVPNAGER